MKLLKQSPLNTASIRLLFLLACILLLTGCQVFPSTQSTATPANTPTSLPSATPTPEPTATPVPERVLLVAPAETSPDLLADAAQKIGSLAASSNLLFETVDSLQTEALSAGTRIAIVLSPPTNLAEIAAASPTIQFVAVQPTFEISPTANLSIIRSDPQQQAFIAGYLTTIIAYDWRAAGFFSTDEAQATLMQEAFINGGNYFCGRCASIYSPILLFPLTANLTSTTDINTWQPQIDSLLQNYLYVIYLSKDAASPEVLSFLAGKEMILVGEVSPAEEYRSRWAATISQDVLSPLEVIWQDLLAGAQGKELQAAIVISDINAEFVSQGRLDKVNQTILDLQADLISPASPEYP